ncbi:MAG: aminotransferase class V-fold PLP-dependent enzyme [Proteobacteria bacterium]|nr:aminotransferase class V-fold PLP-dependent enzyme [Pseudomonadota bacterium]
MLTDREIENLRRDTPGTQTVVHFNHSGASLMPRQVTDAIGAQLAQESRLGPHEAAVPVAARLEKMRADAAHLLGADASEVAITGSGSSGWGLTFAALPPFAAGDRILVGRQEWGGNLATLHAAAVRTGALIETIPCNADGSADAAALDRMIDPRVRLICLTWLPANGGLINDAAAIGRVANRHGIPYFIDAGQALGQIPVDVRAIGCDMLKGAARKFLRGPRGTALLYVRKSMLARMQPAYFDVQSAPWLEGGPRMRGDTRRFESAESSVALWLGLGEALALARAIGVEAIRARIEPMAIELRRRLGAIPGVGLHDLGDGPRSGLVSFDIRGMGVQAVRERLTAEFAINVGANGVAYTPLDMTARGLDGIVRASVSYLNTEKEMDALTAAVAKLAA